MRLEVETLVAREALGETLKVGNAIRLYFDASVDQVIIGKVDSRSQAKPNARKSMADEHVQNVAQAFAGGLTGSITSI
jgi:hypothetical protein